jgi:hypothetical protein
LSPSQPKWVVQRGVFERFQSVAQSSLNISPKQRQMLSRPN